MQQKEKKEEEKNLIKNIKRKPIITQLKKSKMTLKELQNMIKEEFEAYMGEAEDDVDVSVNPDADVDAEIGDEEGEGEGAEDMLRNIYDMLKTKFEAEEEGEEEGEEEEAEDVDEMDMGEADIEENATTDAKFQKQGYAAGGGTKGGPNAGYGNVGGKGSTGYDAKSVALQERFQKLANIIK
jgi:hypothetical protein